MLSHLKRIGIFLSTLVCSVATFFVSIAMSGICSGRSTGTLKVSSCYFGGARMENIANNAYGYVLAGLFLLVPIVLWVGGIVLGGIYRKKNHKDLLGKMGMSLIWLNIIMIIIAIVRQITKIIITHDY